MRDFETLVCYGDLHFPHEDPNFLNIIIKVIKDIKPDYIVDLGDIISCDCLMDYDKKIEQLGGLQEELDASHEWFARVNKVSNNSKKILCRDNHFYRRLYSKMRREQWMEDLKAVQPDYLLKLNEFGWISENGWCWKNTLLFVHGDDGYGGSQDAICNKVRRLVNSNSISVVRGHSHNTGMEVHKHNEDLRWAIQVGTGECLSKIDYIKNKEFNNWTQSFGVFYLSKETKEFWFVPIICQNGRALFNGKLY